MTGRLVQLDAAIRRREGGAIALVEGVAGLELDLHDEEKASLESPASGTRRIEETSRCHFARSVFTRRSVHWHARARIVAAEGSSSQTSRKLFIARLRHEANDGF